MTEQTFLAQTLSSRRLLALLFVCESRRKGKELSMDEWESYLATFADRFASLGETLRFEVLEAHLMSVEDIDIYHDETLRGLLDENKSVLDVLTGKLDQDPRFRWRNNQPLL